MKHLTLFTLISFSSTKTMDKMIILTCQLYFRCWRMTVSLRVIIVIVVIVVIVVIDENDAIIDENVRDFCGFLAREGEE